MFPTSRHPQVGWDKNIEEDSENDYEKEDLDLIVNVNEKVAIFKAVEWNPWASADYLEDHSTSMIMSLITYDLGGTPRTPKD